MALQVTSHIPTINATGVYRNDSVKVTFNKRIKTETIDYTSFSVNDHNTFSSIPGGFSVELDTSGYAYTAVFVPDILLTQNTVYDVYVYGRPDSILGLDNDFILETYSYTFTTGTGVWAEAGVSGLPASGYGVSTYTGTAVSTLEVLSTSPKHQEPNIPSLDYIEIKFNAPLIVSGIYDYITVSSQNVLH